MDNREPPKPYLSFSEFTYRDTPKKRVLSGFRELDYLIKGFEMGCVTLWTGRTNAGKSTVLTHIIKSAIQQNEKVFWFNGEKSKEDSKDDLYHQLSTKDDFDVVQYKDTPIFDSFVKKDRVDQLANKYNRMIFIYNNEFGTQINHLLYAMEEVRRIYEVKIFVLDNFMQIDIQNENVFQEQAKIMEKIRQFAVNNEVHIHLVVHPRKVEKGQVELSLEDIAGTMNMANKAYNVIAIMRADLVERDSLEYKRLYKKMLKERYDIEKTSTILEVLKTKGVRNGLVGLVYDTNTRAFTEQSKLTSELYEKKKHEVADDGQQTWR